MTMSDEKHDYAPLWICANCEEIYEVCECDDPTPEEIDSCDVCGEEQDGDLHAE